MSEWVQEPLFGGPPDTVAVYIWIPEYECPEHYPWGLATRFMDDGDVHEIPREQYERWVQVQEAWDQMNEEMAFLYEGHSKYRKKKYQVIP